MQTITTHNSQETQAFAKEFARSLVGGEVICLCGDLGAGKTTFTQGLLEILGAQGPYTSPTFNIMKVYDLKSENSKPKSIYHIDAYRINSEDLKHLGWQDFAGKPETITIIEWSERVKEIIPPNAIRLHFSWISENQREIQIA